MAKETLTIDDAVFIFPADFIQSIAAQQSGESCYWTTESQVHTLWIETYREDKQLKLAVKSLKLWLKDGCHVCLLENIVKSNTSLALQNFSLKGNKIIDSLSSGLKTSPLKEGREKDEETSITPVQDEPRRKRGRPRKTEAEKQMKKNEIFQSHLENKGKRYTLRGVKLSAEIMNAEKGIYGEAKKKESAADHSSNILNSSGPLINLEHTKVDDEKAKKGNSELNQETNMHEAGINDVERNNGFEIGDSDSDDDFIPEKKRKRGRRKLLHSKGMTNKPRKRSSIDIGNVPRCERRKRNNEKREECRVCGKRFCDYTGLYNHVKKRHEKTEGFQSYLDELSELKVVSCKACGLKFANRTLLFAHEDREHRQTAIVECFRCHKSFRNIVNLRNHVRAVHILKGDKNKLCHLCPAKFKWGATLKQHLDEIHEGNKHAKCQHCEKMFYSNSQLRRHERCHGLHQSKTVMCQQCGRKFLFAHNLKRHVETMHGAREEVYHCSYCGRGYKTRTSMISHVQLVHFNLFSYSCKICKSTFPRSKFLVDHMLSVHKVANYQVTENPRERFKYKKGINNMFYCSYCSEGFHYKAKMVDHIQTVHADVFPHHCEICKQGFLEASFLMNHSLKAHGIESSETGDSQTAQDSQELNNNIVLVNSTGGECLTTEIGSLTAGEGGENSQTMIVQAVDGTGTGNVEVTMSDSAAASLLVEVASGTKTYRYYIETPEGVGPSGAVTVNPQDIANLLLMAEQTIQDDVGAGGSQEGEESVVQGMDTGHQVVDSLVVHEVELDHQGVESSHQELQIAQEVGPDHQVIESGNQGTMSLTDGTMDSSQRDITGLQTTENKMSDNDIRNELVNQLTVSEQDHSQAGFIIDVPYSVT